MVNHGMVNGSRFDFLPVAKSAILRDYTQKSAIQKIR
jgi:hypothetical protein